MKILLLILAVVSFGGLASSQYLIFDPEGSMVDSEAQTFRQIETVLNLELARTKAQLPWFPVSEDNPIRLAACEHDYYCLQGLEEGSTLSLVLEMMPDWPISGTSDQVTVRPNLQIWQDWSESERKIFITGEVFRVIESRLGVFTNSRDGNTYEQLQVPNWLWFGSAIVWGIELFPDESELFLSQAEEAYSLVGFATEVSSRDHYWAAVYISSQLLQQTGLSAHAFFEYDHLVGSGVLESEAFAQTFGITQTEFEVTFR